MCEDFDPTKPCWTMDGRAVTLYTTEHPGYLPIVGRIGESNCLSRWSIKGIPSNSQLSDTLTNTPPKKKYQVWINLYSNGRAGVTHYSRKAADFYTEPGHIECRLIEWEVEREQV